MVGHKASLAYGRACDAFTHPAKKVNAVDILRRFTQVRGTSPWERIDQHIAFIIRKRIQNECCGIYGGVFLDI